MRWVFYALLIINIIFFGWHQLKSDVTAPIGEGAQVETGVLPIQLLSEVGEDTELTLTDRLEAQKCDVYGPFFSAEASMIFLNTVKKASLKGRLEQEKINLKPYFWLYVAPLLTETRAQEVVNRLRGDQLSAEIITEGRLKNGVSLGNVESKEDVERLRQRLSVFDLVLSEQLKSRDYQQFWVVLNPGSEARLQGNLRDRLIEDYPEIIHRQKVCKAVASAS